MSRYDLHALRPSLDLPAVLASCSQGGETTIWQTSLHFVDATHLALPGQGQPATYLTALLTDPDTAQRYRLALHHQRSERAGADWHVLNAYWHLQHGQPLEQIEIYRVLTIERLPGALLAHSQPDFNRLAAVRLLSQRLAAADELAQAFDLVLDGLAEQLAMHHALVLCVDESGQWLYTVASRGYAQSGVGSEVELGQGLIGTVAQYRSAMRLRDLQVDAAAADHSSPIAGTYIPVPHLQRPHSQLAVPIEAGSWLAGVLYVESAQARRFDHEDEDALVAIAQQLGLAMRWLTRPQELPEAQPETPLAAAPLQGPAVTVRYFATTQSVFLDDDYLIKGVAGAVLWLLLNDHVRDGRCESSNRALRLDHRLKLPDFDDNLDTRLLLLQRRLSERCDWLGLDKLGRGRFRLRLERPVKLVDAEQLQSAADAIGP